MAEEASKRLRAGLMGLEGVGGEYLSALKTDDQFELVGVADANSETLRRHAEPNGLRGYEDYRSLIVEGARHGLDLLFVALEPFQSIGFVELAAHHGVGVFHKAPFARSVGEAQKLVRTFDAADCPFVVSRLWQFEPAFALLCQPVIAGGSVYAVTADVRTRCEPSGWRGDSALAGGGVLLNGAYEQIDLLIHLLGLPESVYAQCTMAVPPGAPCPYDTEDAVQVSLGFGGKRMACLTARRSEAQPSWRMVFVAVDRTIELTGERLTVTHRGSGSAEVRPLQRQRAMAAAISAFGAAGRDGGGRVESHAREHLATLAVIEAAYLSAKTGEPESPGRFLA